MDSTIFTELTAGVATSSPEQTEALGQRLAGALPDNCAIALIGDLGAGKTTFVRGLASALGIRETVTSPTYQFYSIYQGTRIQLVHLDAYRLQNDPDAESLYLDEFLREPFLLAVEWPDRASGLLADMQVFHLVLKITPDQRHTIRLLETEPA